jgi:RNA polymerase sigma-70 factor (ECF subfamily)
VTPRTRSKPSRPPPRRNGGGPDDDKDVSGRPAPEPGGGQTLLDLYEQALPQVYGYLLRRCGSVPVAEDLTAETFLAAVAAVRDGSAPPIEIGWLIGVARHKLVDHWRRVAREERSLSAAGDPPVAGEDRWDAELDAIRARDVLGRLSAHHRAALTLRYLDGLPVAEVAAKLGRTLHATEALLVRGRAAFRRLYEEGGDD